METEVEPEKEIAWKRNGYEMGMEWKWGGNGNIIEWNGNEMEMAWKKIGNGLGMEWKREGIKLEM